MKATDWEALGKGIRCNGKDPDCLVNGALAGASTHDSGTEHQAQEDKSGLKTATMAIT
jgi:hypothetical protein